jgi:hypothetical protein
MGKCLVKMLNQVVFYVLEKDFDHPVSAPWVEGTAELKKAIIH